MKRKKIFIIASLLISVICISILTFFFASFKPWSIRTACINKLYSHRYMLLEYNHKFGVFPPDIETYKKYLQSHSYIMFACPSSIQFNKKKLTDDNFERERDYVFISPAKEPYKFPVLYDRNLKNHGSEGINILAITNKTVEIFWDQQAQWLIQFAKEHPEYNIPLPDDLSNKVQIEAEIEKTRKEKGISVGEHVRRGKVQ